MNTTDYRDAVSGDEREAFERAVVTFPAPHGADAVTLRDGDVARFGRGAECEIRFGYAPRPDRGLPRVAGRLVAANGRVFVESSGDPSHRALSIRAEGGTIASIGVGEAHSPRESRFEVLVPGDGAPWCLTVTTRDPEAPGAAGDSVDPPTVHYELRLTPLQERVLAAYAEPIRRGAREPATHQQVAAELHYHRNTVRDALYEIYNKMFEAQIPMPDMSDKRFAVVEAARAHGLLRD